jgi:hypothetical protein
MINNQNGKCWWNVQMENQNYQSPKNDFALWGHFLDPKIYI